MLGLSNVLESKMFKPCLLLKFKYCVIQDFGFPQENDPDDIKQWKFIF